MKLVKYTSAIFFGSAIAGAGARMGRDAYGKVKKEFVGVAILIAICAGIYLTFRGSRGLIRHYDRGLWGTIFLTFICNMAIIFIGYMAFMFPVAIIFDSPDPVIQAEMINNGKLIWASIAFIGLLVGFFQRGKRKRMFVVEAHNKNFLTERDITELGGEGIFHMNGETVRFLGNESSKTLFSFLVTGKRGKRFHIKLNEQGKMFQLTKNY